MNATELMTAAAKACSTHDNLRRCGPAEVVTGSGDTDGTGVARILGVILRNGGAAGAHSSSEPPAATLCSHVAP